MPGNRGLPAGARPPPGIDGPLGDALWANGQNAYIGKVREGLRRLGSVPLRKVGAHLVLRGPGEDGKAPSAASGAGHDLDLATAALVFAGASPRNAREGVREADGGVMVMCRRR